MSTTADELRWSDASKLELRTEKYRFRLYLGEKPLLLVIGQRKQHLYFDLNSREQGEEIVAAILDITVEELRESLPK